MGIKFREKPMGQRYAKHQMQSGVKLYHQRRHQQAIEKWRGALRRLNAEDRFITLGYMAQSFCDSGDYENMLHYALQQMELANSRQDDFMKSEAFLNLSKACERLADFSKAIMYGKASLQHPSIDPRTPGYAYLTIALAYMGFSQFQSSLDAFEKAMNVANQTGDKLLELQICVGLGSLFTLLRDLSKALIFLRNALSILQLVTVDNIHAKYKSLILYHLSVVLRVKGSLVDAREACEEAIRLSHETNSKSIYARCLASLADIYRELGESEARETVTKSWARYEQAFRLMSQLNDRLGQVIVLGSMAKSASESRAHYSGQCECQAIQLNKKCLEIAKMIGCKHAMMKCHLRLQELYSQLSDEDSEEVAKKCATTLIQEMELFCNFCGQRYATHDGSLQALRCSHIFHEKCLQSFLNGSENPSCPKCQCKAILMDNISVRTSSVSSGNGVEPSPITANCIGPQNLPPGAVQTCLVGLQPDQPSTSAAARKMMALQAQMAIDLQDELPLEKKKFQPSITIQGPSQETVSDDFSRSVTPAGPSKTIVSASIHYPPPPPPKPSTSKSFAREEITRTSSFSPSKSKSPKSPKPPPPPRKPSCNVDSFPPLPEELLAAITNYQDPTNGNMPSVDEEGTYQVVSRGPGITDV